MAESELWTHNGEDMAFEKQFCANDKCPKHRIHTGGLFRFRVSDRKTFCDDCFRVEVQLNGARNLYEFTTTHLNGEPIHVRDKAHLRQLERQFGVSHHQLNNMERNWQV